MGGTLILLNIIGGVCLLLWGLRHVRNSVTEAFGANLYKIIAKSTGNRFSAFLSGIGVTALLQSSTATVLIIASFCGRGVMSTSAGVGVILGADVGTTLVAQLLTLNLSWFAPLLMISGFVFNGLGKGHSKAPHIGTLLIGIGIMLFSLVWIAQSSVPLKESEIIRLVLGSLQNDPVMAILITAILTWLAHSSLAIILLLVSLSVGGIVTVDVAMFMVLGANLGGVIAPFIATIKDNPEATYVPIANIVIRVTGVILCLPFIHIIGEYLMLISDAPERLLVNFHTFFNVALAIIFLPLTKQVSSFVKSIVPAKDDAKDPGRPIYLKESELDKPSVALSAAVRETLRLSDILQSMLEDTLLVMRDNDEKLARDIRKRDDVVDDIYKAVKMYIARLAHEKLDDNESKQYAQVLKFSTNLESAGDLIDKSLIDMALKKIKDKKLFSEEGWEEIEEMHETVLTNMRMAQNVFLMGDRKLARDLVQSKDKVRLLEEDATENHLDRIREGRPESITSSSLHLDIMRDYRRLNSYMASVAYPILHTTGDLRRNRLRPIDRDDKKKQDKKKTRKTSKTSKSSQS